MNENLIDCINLPAEEVKIIKVIGVGGGGNNAVSHMYRQGIHDVSFMVCNTDNQALKGSPVPVKIQLGPHITEGLGAGNDPDKGRAAAEESEESIRQHLDDGTKMVFVTTGMGGGTGTGAGPVIARIAKEMGILTVGIVTIPFLFEGKKKILKALDGVERMAANVDALLVINNERLLEIYKDEDLIRAFAHADDTLLIAAKSIAEIITKEGIINRDFADVCTTLRDGGIAIMSTGKGTGENRLAEAIENALHSPLLNSNKVYQAKKVLIYITFCKDFPMKAEEMNHVHDFLGKFSDEKDVIWGVGTDETLGESVQVTLLATGFGMENLPEMREKRTIDDVKARELMKEHYGNDAKVTGFKKKLPIYLFTLDTLGDEEIIAKVEDSPTYRREQSDLNFINKITHESI
ncbi:MAG: cell division protein FtsZ [Prevotellaceae bacterium]|nr:cell division protein FtsZ [Prevotellaceae bacterium]